MEPWTNVIKRKCVKNGWRCKVRQRGHKLYARVLDWGRDNDLQNILSAVKEDWPHAKITSGYFPSRSWIDLGGDVTFRLNP